LSLYKTLQNPALVQALAHPLRAKILYVLQEQEASPKELAAHLNTPLANIAYHIQVLRKLKLIRLVKTTPRRGAVEHHYKADHAANIDDEAWKQTPGLIKERMVAALLEDIGGSVTQAAGTGGFDRHNAHLSRTRLVLDEEAWDVLAAKLEEVLELVDDLQAESTRRLKAADHEGERSSGLVMMLFESLPGVPEADAARQSRPSTSDPAERHSAELFPE
jgi:DNA-binding transcriptional ArsR family regulator